MIDKDIENSIIEEQILFELKKLNRIISLVNGSKLESELEKYISTDERKKVWTLINGERNVSDLINLSRLKRRSVYEFLEILENAALVQRRYSGCPTRMIDYVPATWIGISKDASIKDTIQNTNVSYEGTDESPNLKDDLHG